MSDLHNILNNNEELNEEQLMKYLHGNLSTEEQHAIEQQMAGSEFMNDAVEGLQNFKSKKDINKYVDDLNAQLQKHTANKKQRKLKRRLKNMDGIELTVVIVILLCLLGYFVVSIYEKNKKTNTSIEINK